MTQTLDEKLQAWVGRATGDPVTAELPVNEAMIAHWCGAMGDRNPLYQSRGVAPPIMLQVWTMRPFAAEIQPDGGFEVLELLDEAGFRGVVATNSEQEYLRYLRAGDRITETTMVEAVSGEKPTGLGRGYFVTLKYEFTDQNGEVVGRMRFRVLKFKPPEKEESAPAQAPAGGEMPKPRRPRPAINRDNAFFWEGASKRQLLIQRCSDCGKLRHPPGPMCPSCHSLKWETVSSTGRGTVHSFVVMHRPAIPPFETPNPIVLVDLEEGIRLVAGISGCTVESLEIGMPVALEFVEVEPGYLVPNFHPCRNAAQS